MTDALLTSVKLDLSDHDALVAFMQQCEVDIVCNTAGVLDDFKPIGETSEADFADILQTNLNAVFTITKHLIQQNRPTRVC
ncbi:SDR family NAD(P)-dependent oxidoreductase [Latilactobacillus fuchuensis]|uniref:SDR family NAD(P)-dependent oxidoreductase n=1 Tax=Latilactobacillus fuchuensis TaxID=164393 RepID=UPI000687C0BE|nr:SDR family NAD(P)-dependent oxidoreductase [Latilactobacillus fuchuensis]